MTAARAAELVEALTDQGIAAACDVRKLPVPGVLVPPPTRRYDLPCGYTVAWQLVAVAPGPGNLDTWAALDKLVDAAEAAADALDLALEQAVPSSYTLAAGTDPLPCYLITATEAS